MFLYCYFAIIYSDLYLNTHRHIQWTDKSHWKWTGKWCTLLNQLCCICPRIHILLLFVLVNLPLSYSFQEQFNLNKHIDSMCWCIQDGIMLQSKISSYSCCSNSIWYHFWSMTEYFSSEIGAQTGSLRK